MQTTAMTKQFDGDDYNLLVLIERMQRLEQFRARDRGGCAGGFRFHLAPGRPAPRRRGGARYVRWTWTETAGHRGGFWKREGHR